MAISQGEYRALVIGSAPNWSTKLTTKICQRVDFIDTLNGELEAGIDDGESNS